MDVVLVGLPGSGKTAIARRLAKRHRAELVDVDARIEAEGGTTIADIFATEGEAAFRRLERAAIRSLGPASVSTLSSGPAARAVERVISTGGGAVVDPRNRWDLYRRGLVVWLDVRPEVAVQRLRNSPHERPLVAGRDPLGTVRRLAASRERFYAAGERVNGVAEMGRVIDVVDEIVREHVEACGSDEGARAAGQVRGTVLLRASTPVGRIVLGHDIAAAEVARALADVGASRALVVSEAGAWEAFGAGLGRSLGARGIPVETVMLPRGEAAKRLSVIEEAARELSRLRVERREPIVAVGGGALGDAAGFLAATYLRGIPVIHVPTTLVAQVDSSIGGKTAVDLPEGKNLVGAFHQPFAVIADVAALETLPDRERRAALGEAVKMAVLGDDRLFELLEAEGDAIARGDPQASESGAVAELVERAGWAKVEVVSVDPHEQDPASGRITLNLGHSLGHAIEAAGGFEDLRHGEAVAFGLRAASAIGVRLGVTPPTRATRIGRLLEGLDLGVGSLPYPPAAIRDALAADKKHAGGRLRWVLPAETGVVVRDDVPDETVDEAILGLVSADGGGMESGRATASGVPR